MEQNAYFNRGLEIIRRLNELTYEAYFVGGVVRDYLLKLPFHDIDIATSATPQQVLGAFPHGNKEYISLGVVTLKEQGMIYEITTFKTEEYTTIRKPSQVHYSTKLQEDIPRRDFTINGLAMSANLKIIDFCNGKKDLEAKRIRVIGKPKKRFKEDPLRIIRACSLVARFGFTIEKKTADGMKATKQLLTKLSSYKIAIELKKIFTAPFGKSALKEMKHLDLFPYLTYFGLGLPFVYRYFDELSLLEKYAVCFHTLGNIPEHTGLTHQELKEVGRLLELTQKLATEPIQPLLLYEYGLDLVLSADKICRITTRRYKTQAKIIENVHKQTVHISTSDLSFKGQHLVELTGGKTGPFIGEIIETLKKQIIMGILPNNYDILKNEAMKLLEEYENKDKKQEEPHPLFQKQEQVVPPSRELPYDQTEQEELYEQYRGEFQKLYLANIANIPDFNQLPIDEQEAIKKRVSTTIRDILVTKNPKYRIFEVIHDKV